MARTSSTPRDGGPHEQRPFDLTGCVALVTGASGRLGPSMVETLAGAGAHVVAVARDLDPARGGARATSTADLRACDITSPEWPALVASVAEEHGRIDVLVNNAHVGRGGSLRLAQPEDFAEAFGLAVTATADGINAARAGLAASAAAGGPASVVNIASMYGVVAPDPRVYDSEEGRNPPAYGAAKAAMLQLTRYAAAELAPEGIRVNSITLGPFPGLGHPRDRGALRADRRAAPCSAGSASRRRSPPRCSTSPRRRRRTSPGRTSPSTAAGRPGRPQGACGRPVAESIPACSSSTRSRSSKTVAALIRARTCACSRRTSSTSERASARSASRRVEVRHVEPLTEVLEPLLERGQLG